MNQTLSTSSVYEGPGWRKIREEQAWEDFLAWCREQENAPHE